MSILLAAMGVGLIGMGLAGSATTGAGAEGTSGAVTGTVFRDYNGNGAKDDLEPGQEGIEVRAFDASGAPVGAAVRSAADGTYTLAISAGDGTAVRVDFGIPAAYNFLQSSPVGDGNGTSSGTSVQFTTVGTRANFGVWNPSEYCHSNPTLVLACHTFGDAVKGTSSVNGALKTFPADAKGSPPGNLARFRTAARRYPQRDVYRLRPDDGERQRLARRVPTPTPTPMAATSATSKCSTNAIHRASTARPVVQPPVPSVRPTASANWKPCVTRPRSKSATGYGLIPTAAACRMPTRPASAA